MGIRCNVTGMVGAPVSALSDALNEKQIAEPSARGFDWPFTMQPAPHDPNTFTVSATSGTPLEGEKDWSEFVTNNGGTIVPGYRIRLVEMRHNTHGWTRAKEGQKATTQGTWFYRFMVEPISARVDVEDLLGRIGKAKKCKDTPAVGGSGVYNWIAGDLQLGKSDGDGSEGIVAALIGSIDAAVLDFKRLGGSKRFGIVHLGFLGDCGEGNQSQGGRNMWRTDLTVTEQYRIFRRIMLYAIDAFRHLVDSIEVDVVNGNHDEVQRFQSTREDDGHATESAIALRDALELNPDAYSHVSVFVPNKDEATITRPVGDTVMTMTHGHKWRRGKAFDWWAGQSLNWHAPGASQMLLHGHEHEFHVNAKRERTVICCPSFESESTWWRHKTGDVGKRGAVVFTSAAGEFSDMRII